MTLLDGEFYVAGRFSKTEVAGHDGGQHGPDAATVERVGLDDQHGTTEAGL